VHSIKCFMGGKIQWCALKHVFQCMEQFMVLLHSKGLNGSVQKDHLGS